MLSFLKGFSSGIQSKYSVGQESFKVGPWTVHDGKVRSSGEPVSVFVFDKSSLTKSLPQGVRKSVATQQVTDYAQRGVSELVKLRHPSIVRLVEPIEQSSRSLLFVTERLTLSLESLIAAKQHESPGSEELNELAIERGALVLCQGLRFLHETGRVHTNLCPSSVFVAANGDWKIGGLEFLSEPTDDFFFPDTDPRLPGYLRLNLNFLAPETCLDHRLGPENDVWALASILYTCYTLKEPLDCRGNPNSYKEEYTKFARKLKTLPPLAPRLGSALAAQLFERDHTQRLDVGGFEQTDYFNHSLVKALQFIDDFETKSPSDKVQFLKYLQEILDQFPKAILRRKVLQFVTKELAGPGAQATTSDTSCTLQLSNLLFAISAGLSQLTFQQDILPLFKTLQASVPFQESLVGNIGVVVSATSEKNFVKDVVPIFESILKENQGGTQRILLDNTPLFVGHVTISCLEQKLFPLVLTLFGATQAKSVKLACLGSFSTMILNKLSTLLVTDKLLPALEEMKTRDPSVVMAVKELYENVATKVGISTVIEKILPRMCELSLSRDLTIPQFKSLVASMRTQLDKFETEQVKLLTHNREENNTFSKESLESAPAASRDMFMSEAFQPREVASKPVGIDFFESTSQPVAPVAPVVKPNKPNKPVAPISPTIPGPQRVPLQAPVLEPKRKPSNFDDDFGSFSGGQSQSGQSQWSQPSQSSQSQWSQPSQSSQSQWSQPIQPIQPSQPNQPNQSTYTSPFLVSSITPTPKPQDQYNTLQPQDQWNTPQPQGTPSQPSWMQPLQPTKR